LACKEAEVIWMLTGTIWTALSLAALVPVARVIGFHERQAAVVAA
jgi:hypothetical protein